MLTAPPMPDAAPPRNPRLLRWTAIWSVAALAWTTLSAVAVLNTPDLLRWLLFSRHARYVLLGAVLLMVFWGEARKHVGERTARVYLALVATLFGAFGALLVLGLKLTPFLTILALASFSFGAMVLAGLFVPVSLRKPRQALEVVRRVAELTLAGVTLGPELGWLQTGIILLGLAAVLVTVGDDVQAVGDESRVVKDDQVQLVATVRAVDLYLSYFRLTLVFAQLLGPRRKPKK